jgi:ferredoxin
MNAGPVCLGLGRDSTNDEIREAAFDFVTGLGYMVFSTVCGGGGGAAGPAPNARGLEVHYLDDAKNLYVGASRGKGFPAEVGARPLVCAVAVKGVAVRIGARLAPVGREGGEGGGEAAYARYWRQNPGTEKMYRKDLGNFQLYRLESGEGEVFHVYEDDKIARVRFSFGGWAPRPWRYVAGGPGCTGCGACAERCMMGVIEVVGGVAVPDHYGCNECGICREACPCGAVAFHEAWGTDQGTGLGTNLGTGLGTDQGGHGEGVA